MIRSNLATRPFYNERAVRLWIGLAILLVIAVSVFNVSRVLYYSRRDAVLETQAARDEARRSELRAAAAELRASVDSTDMARLSFETVQANSLISRRMFSWTDLLNRFETTLPSNTRITAVRPEVQDGRRALLEVRVVASGVDEVAEFMQRLEDSGAFVDALARDEAINEEGQIEAAIGVAYVPRSSRSGTENAVQGMVPPP
jgi:hypothetical protein